MSSLLNPLRTRPKKNVELGEKICSQLKSEPVIALDCEGVDLGPIGSLSMVQISTPSNKTCWIFDIFACPQLIQLLREAVFENDRVLKIVHDCRSERSNLRQQFGITLMNVFDTQIAFHMMKGRDNKRTSLTNVLRYYRLPENPWKSTFQSDFYRANPRFWERRPLSQDMIKYAAADIAHLHYIYERMKRFQDNATFKRRCAAADLHESDAYLPSGERNPDMTFFADV